jgi:hypothetical protein
MAASRSAYGSRIDLTTLLGFAVFLLAAGYGLWLTGLALLG